MLRNIGTPRVLGVLGVACLALCSARGGSTVGGKALSDAEMETIRGGCPCMSVKQLEGVDNPCDVNKLATPPRVENLCYVCKQGDSVVEVQLACLFIGKQYSKLKVKRCLPNGTYVCREDFPMPCWRQLDCRPPADVVTGKCEGPEPKDCKHDDLATTWCADCESHPMDWQDERNEKCESP